MADDFGDRTEQPTERRRTEARRKGNVARSVDMSAAMLMLAVSAVLHYWGPELCARLAAGVSHTLHSLENPRMPGVLLSLDAESVHTLSRHWVSQTVGILGPALMLLVAVAIAGNLAQVGFLLSGEAIQPKWSRLNPWTGLQRIVSLRGVVKLLVSLAKLVLLTAIASAYVAVELPGIMELADGSGPKSVDAGPSGDVPLIASLIGQSLSELAFLLALALLMVGILDFAFQKWKHEQELMMTRQEVRDEMKEMEGDPQIRQRRREAHRKLAEARELQQVEDADVVITNPTHIAVALKYDPQTMAAPTVIAKGMGALAERIRTIAAEHGIPIIERKPLARALYKDVRVGQTIPMEMYQVFVEIMAYVYELTGQRPDGLSDDG